MQRMRAGLGKVYRSPSLAVPRESKAAGAECKKGMEYMGPSWRVAKVQLRKRAQPTLALAQGCAFYPCSTVVVKPGKAWSGRLLLISGWARSVKGKAVHGGLQYGGA